MGRAGQSLCVYNYTMQDRVLTYYTATRLDSETYLKNIFFVKVRHVLHCTVVWWYGKRYFCDTSWLFQFAGGCCLGPKADTKTGKGLKGIYLACTSGSELEEGPGSGLRLVAQQVE